MAGELTTRQLPEAPQPGNLLEVIARAAMDPGVDVEKFERLVALQERVERRAAEVEYAAAMSRLQAELPQIERSGTIEVKGSVHGRFAQREDIDDVVRPLMAREGFSYSWDEEEATPQGRRFVGKVTHRKGHSEVKRITLALDSTGSKNSTQAGGSTSAYAGRYLLSMHLNLVTKGVDNDANGVAISDDEAKDLDSLIQEVGADRARFLKFMGVSSVFDIPKRELSNAIAALEEKRGKSR